MSLFGFVKEIGRNVFNKDEDAAEKIAELIEQSKLKVDGLKVQFDNGIVDLCGECDSPETFDKAVLMAGNVKGVVDVYTSDLTIKPSPAAQASAPEVVMQKAPEASSDKQTVPVVADAPKVEYYVIQSGDTLGKIAKQFLGNAGDYPKIFEANREVIEDPDKIYPGQKIRIPLG